MSRPVAFCLALAALLGVASVQLSLSGAGPRQPTSIDSSRVGPLPRNDSAASAKGAPPLRVLLERSVDAPLSIRIDGPYLVKPLGDWRVLAQGESLKTADIAASEGGIRIGLRDFPHYRVEVEVVESGTLWVGQNRYHGNLRLVRRAGDHFAAVNVVGLEDYVASVVAGEMPDAFPDAAREAQAVAARSYAIYQSKTFGAGSDFDVRDSSRSQRYLGIEQESDDGGRMRIETAESRRAAAATRGIVVVYEGRLIPTYYSAVCGGHTNSGKSLFSATWPPLVGVACEHCSQAPHYRWHEVLDWNDLTPRLTEFLDQRGRDVGNLERLEVVRAAGAVLPSVRIVGTEGYYDVPANEFRLRIAGSTRLLSPNFQLDTVQTELHFRGRGWGHGVGMCQWGARGRALEGDHCAAILAYYYPGTELVYVR